MQRSERRKSKNQDNFNQKPAKVKKKRRTPSESNEAILEVETNVIQHEPVEKKPSKQKLSKQSSKLSRVPSEPQVRDIETQQSQEQREDNSEVKCLLSFILFFTIVTCGFVTYLFYQSLSAFTNNKL